MQLGAFSVSLSVKDLATSKSFYEKLGFTVFGGAMEHNYLIMKNGKTLIGLFQSMFDENLLTFNPGWDQDAQDLDNYDSVHDIQAALKKQGIAIEKETTSNEGPASFVIKDPDGNIILVDQHRE